MPSQPTLKPPATVRHAGLILYPAETDASRRDALRVVNENLRAAERFALGQPVAMAPQPVQQQQAKAGETAAEWGARMDRLSPRPTAKLLIPAGYVDSPAIRAMDAAAAEAGRRYGEAQNAVRAELDITAVPARAGRYGKAA